MRRKLAATTFALLLLGLPALAEDRKTAPEESATALHLMNDTEFSSFLARLDGDVAGWESQLKAVDMKSLGLEPQDAEELERSDRQCLQSLRNTDEEIQRLSRKQTLRLDLLLLVDLSDLARNLDGFDRDLASAAASTGTTQKSMGYVREVLGIDSAVGVHTATFQSHVLAFAKVVDAKLQQVEDGVGEAPAPK